MTSREEAKAARLRADLAAASQRGEDLQDQWAVATYTSSGTTRPEDIDVELAEVGALIAELDVALAGEGATPAPPVAVPSPAQPANDVPEFLDTRDASAVLGVSVKTLEALRARRSGPPWVKVGRRVRYERARLLEWARQK